MQGNGSAFEVVGGPLSHQLYGIGFVKGDVQLRDAVQHALQSLIDDGTYGRILDKWGVARAGLKSATVNGAGES